MSTLSLWSAKSPSLHDNAIGGDVRERLSTLLTTGGDARIIPDASGMNRYHGFSRPVSALAYGSSTISSISADALEHLRASRADWINTPPDEDGYAAALNDVRHRLRHLFTVPDCDIVFAASGTDLEYAGLAAMPPAAAIDAILLGRDEVGSGCIHSAAGRFFATTTAIGDAVQPGLPIDTAHGDVRLIDVPVRDADGQALESAVVCAALETSIDAALAAGRHPVVHVVHGSKTGLILPDMGDVTRIAGRYDARITLVIDACQLRITPRAVQAYLALGAVVLMTGSKFAGGPPFSGFALLPAGRHRIARPLTPGYAAVFARGEWPADWPGNAILTPAHNPGLLLRLEAALFEMERFAALPHRRVAAIVDSFAAAVAGLSDRIGCARVRPHATTAAGLCAAHPLAMRSLQTLDLGTAWPDADFTMAQDMHDWMCRHARTSDGRMIRLGQPVRTRLRADGRHAGTLRLSLSMPLIAALAALSDDECAAILRADMAEIGEAITAAYHAVTHSAYGEQRAA